MILFLRHEKSAKPNCSPPYMVFGVTVANKKLRQVHAITREHLTFSLFAVFQSPNFLYVKETR